MFWATAIIWAVTWVRRAGLRPGITTTRRPASFPSPAEHGPRGGDEMNLIEPGKNYGWPLVSFGVNYNRVPIQSPDSRPDLVKPVIYWTPVIAPGNLSFYECAMFPEWQGSALVGGLKSRALIRITFDGKGGAEQAERWAVGFRVRDVAIAPDGAIWLIQDANPGGLFRLSPRSSRNYWRTLWLLGGAFGKVM